MTEHDVSWERTRLDHRSRQAASIAAGALSLLTEQGAAALTMAAIAGEAGVSRQTLYRYYRDVDAVLVGIAELLSAHDEAFAELVNQQLNPTAQLDLVVTTAVDHGHQGAEAIVAALPPAGRDILARHQRQTNELLSEILQRGVGDGSFRRDIHPRADAPLIMGLLAAADPAAPDRAITLVHHLVQSQAQPEEPSP